MATKRAHVEDAIEKAAHMEDKIEKAAHEDTFKKVAHIEETIDDSVEVSDPPNTRTADTSCLLQRPRPSPLITDCTTPESTNRRTLASYRSSTSMSLSPGGSRRKEKQQQHESVRENFVLHCRQIFNEFDTDQSGSINANELHVALVSAGIEIAPRQVRQLIRSCDSDGDGEVSFDEFLNFVDRYKSQTETLDDAKCIGGSIGMAVDKLLARRQAQMLKIGSKEEKIIEERTAAVCPQKHKLVPISFTELGQMPYFFGYGGYVCGNCGVHSDHVVLEGCTGCKECEYIVCGACHANLKAQLVDSEISRQIKFRKNKMWTFQNMPKSPSKEYRKKSSVPLLIRSESLVR